MLKQNWEHCFYWSGKYVLSVKRTYISSAYTDNIYLTDSFCKCFDFWKFLSFIWLGEYFFSSFLYFFCGEGGGGGGRGEREGKGEGEEAERGRVTLSFLKLKSSFSEIKDSKWTKRNKKTTEIKTKKVTKLI